MRSFSCYEEPYVHCRIPVSYGRGGNPGRAYGPPDREQIGALLPLPSDGLEAASFGGLEGDFFQRRGAARREELYAQMGRFQMEVKGLEKL